MRKAKGPGMKSGLRTTNLIDRNKHLKIFPDLRPVYQAKITKGAETKIISGNLIIVSNIQKCNARNEENKKGFGKRLSEFHKREAKTSRFEIKRKHLEKKTAEDAMDSEINKWREKQKTKGGA